MKLMLALAGTLAIFTATAEATTFSVVFSDFDLNDGIYTYGVEPDQLEMVLRTDEPSYFGTDDIIGFVTLPSTYPTVLSPNGWETLLDSDVLINVTDGTNLLVSGVGFSGIVEDFGGTHISSYIFLGFSVSQIYDIESLGVGTSKEYSIDVEFEAFEEDSLTFEWLGNTDYAWGTAKASVTILSNPGATVVPLPASLPVLGAGLGCLALVARRRTAA